MSSLFEVVPLSPDCFWGKFDPPTIQFCENNLCGVITQPANTWSNLAYIFIGIYLLIKKPASRITGWVAILIGISSFLYHASFTFLMQYFDLSSMFLYSAFFLTTNLCRIGIIKADQQTNAMFSIVLISMLLLYFFRMTGIPIFAMQILTAVGIEIYIFRKNSFSANYKFILIALALFLIAFGVWWLDLLKIFCNSDNHYFQGHAIWHLFTAFSIYYIDKFYFELSLSKENPNRNSV